MNAAHLHLILNHVPVLGAFATLVLVGYAAFSENETIAKLALRLMVLIGVLTLPVYFSGEPAEEVIEHLPGVTESFISEHEKFALFGLVLTEILAVVGVIGLVVTKKNPLALDRYWNSIGVIALVNAMIMMATAGLGGEIRHTEIRKATSPGAVQTELKSSAREGNEERGP